MNNKLEPSNQLNSLSMNQAQKANHLSSEQSQSPKSEPSQAEPEGLLKSQAEAKSSPKSLLPNQSQAEAEAYCITTKPKQRISSLSSSAPPPLPA